MDLSVSEKFDLLKTYIATFQTCRKCGMCFQNRNQVYQGQVPLCHKCRMHHRPAVVVVKFKTIDHTHPSQIVMKEEYVIPIDELDIDMIASLNALHHTMITSQPIEDDQGIHIRKTSYPNSKGQLFHETFSRQQYLGKFNPFHHDPVKFYKYTKIIL
jgi:hypothetical protein